MKRILLRSAFVTVLTAGMLTSCVKSDPYDAPQLNDCKETGLVKNREVSDILATSTVTLHQNITPGVSDVIEAYVTSSDVAGNFFKSISMQTLDGSRAFSVPVDATSTYINYEPGRKVLIKMDGLYTDIKYGGMRIGSLFANSSGGAEVGRIPEADFNKSVSKSCVAVKEDQLVLHVPNIATLLNDSYLNKLVELDNVEFEASATASTYYNPANDLGGATNYNMIDKTGGAMIFRTSSFANFAAKPVASGSGKVRGILTKFNTDYQFMVRSENDIKLTAPRFIPFLNETFTNNQGDWTSFSVVGAEVWTFSSTFGNPGGMMKMSGFATTNKANEDWLISPQQDLSTYTAATLSFDNSYKFTGNPIEVYISRNYSGTGSPYAAGVTWTQITGATLSAGNFVYANSGLLNISAFTGTGNENIHVAFKYTSTTAAASTWEIDNVKVNAN